MAVEIKKLSNANVYIDGVTKVGSAKEIQLPEVTHKMQEHVALGLYGSLEYASGAEIMESTITWGSFYTEFFGKFANPYLPVQVMVRGNLETFGAGAAGRIAEEPYVCHMVLTTKVFPMGNIVAHEATEFETQHSVSSVKLVVGGQTIIDYDVAANRYIANGVDVLAGFNANL